MATATPGRGADLVRLILVVLGAILLFIGWYNWLT
jgi:hypothetical protein